MGSLGQGLDWCDAMTFLKNCCLLGLFSISVVVALGQAPQQRAAPRGRLPAHYKDLVSPDQREEIYAIQAKHNTEIKELEAKIEKLKKVRDAEVERVLTPAQQARLKLILEGKEKGAAGAKPKNDALVGDAAKGDDKDVFPK
jgi:hypothetical protein